MTYNDKQLHILETAETLFSAKGFDGASVRDIAESAGVNIAMISYYFGSKEKLMQTIFERRTLQLSEKLEDLLQNEALTPFEKLDIIIEDYVNRVISKEQFYKIMICEQLMNKNTVVSELLWKLKSKNTALMEKLLADGVAKKSFKRGIDAVLLMNTLIGTTMQAYVGREYYRAYHNLQNLSDDEFKTLLQNKITTHIKQTIKATLQYEG